MLSLAKLREAAGASAAAPLPVAMVRRRKGRLQTSRRIAERAFIVGLVSRILGILRG